MKGGEIGLPKCDHFHVARCTPLADAYTVMGDLVHNADVDNAEGGAI
jgi:hypothetical protein